MKLTWLAPSCKRWVVLSASTISSALAASHFRPLPAFQYMPKPVTIITTFCRLLDKSSIVRRRAVQVVKSVCEALASQDTNGGTHDDTGLLSVLFKPLSLIICPPDESAMVTAEEEQKVITIVMQTSLV